MVFQRQLGTFLRCVNIDLPHQKVKGSRLSSISVFVGLHGRIEYGRPQEKKRNKGRIQLMGQSKKLFIG